MQEKEISIIIPAHNSEKCIEQLTTEIHTELTSKNIDFEIIIIDDSSTDNNWQIIKDTSKKLSNVKAFLLAKNFGQHKATLCGFHNATGKYIVTIDDDFEHNPQDIFLLIDKLKETNGDIVYGIPTNLKKSFTRKITTKFYKNISKVENPHAGVGSSFRVLSKDLVTKIINHHNHLFFIDELILWYTSNIFIVNLHFNDSQKSNSSYNYSKLLSLSSDVFLISTTIQLKFVKRLGISVSFISFTIGLIFLLKKIIFKTPAGYTSIIVSILFSSGLILLCLGIIGEYLANVLLMQNNKPAFYIKDKI